MYISFSLYLYTVIAFAIDYKVVIIIIIISPLTYLGLLAMSKQQHPKSFL